MININVFTLNHVAEGVDIFCDPYYIEQSIMAMTEAYTFSGVITGDSGFSSLPVIPI